MHRTDEHLATLNAKRRAFFVDEDRRILGYSDRRTSEYVFHVSRDPPDTRIGLIVAELSHHLRATLDNLLWQLVLLRGGNATGKTQSACAVVTSTWWKVPVVHAEREHTGHALRTRAALRCLQTWGHASPAWWSYSATRPRVSRGFVDSGGGIRTRDLRVMRCPEGVWQGRSGRYLREISLVRWG